MKIWKSQTLISSMMLIKIFAIKSCVIEDTNDARLQLVTPNQTYSYTYFHLHLKSGSLPFYFKKINYSFYFTCIEKSKRKNKIEQYEPINLDIYVRR